MARKFPELTLENMLVEAADFAEAESEHTDPALFGVTDGKVVGTYLDASSRTILRNATHSTPAVLPPVSTSRV